MEGLNPGERMKSEKLEVGKKVSIGTNRLVSFRIETSGGTIISGLIPANEYLEITNGGDVINAEISINDITKGPREVDNQ